MLQKSNENCFVLFRVQGHPQGRSPAEAPPLQTLPPTDSKCPLCVKHRTIQRQLSESQTKNKHVPPEEKVYLVMSFPTQLKKSAEMRLLGQTCSNARGSSKLALKVQELRNIQWSWADGCSCRFPDALAKTSGDHTACHCLLLLFFTITQTNLLNFNGLAFILRILASLLKKHLQG